jgi:addiction module RelE/StbE family toxin
MSNDKYIIKFTPKAREDLEQIYCYISEKLFADIAAINLVDNIENSIMRLKKFPYSGSPASDDILKSKGYRKLIVDNYIAFYKVEEDSARVIIMRILYGAQNYIDIL